MSSSRTVMLVVLVFLLVVAVSSTVFAATINVAAGGDIQAAIDGAGAGDVIVLAAGTYAGPIDFSGKAITIQGQADGNGQPASIISGGSGSTIVNCATGEGRSTVLELVEIRNGAALAGAPGGMVINGASPTIYRCVFRGNQAGGGGMAGGLGMWSSNARIDRCTFEANTGQNDGGGLYAYGSNPQITNCTFRNNVVLHRGGGIALEECGGVVVDYCLFEGNGPQPAASAFWGAGLYVKGGSGAVTNCLFRNNGTNLNGTAELGGGLYDCGSLYTYSGNRFEGNSAGNGGGVYLDGSRCTLHHNVLAGNTASTNGGGLLAQDTQATANGPTVVNNTFYNNSSAPTGGCLAADQSWSEFRNNIVAGSPQGSGLWASAGTLLSAAYNCVFGNAGGAYGGGLADQTGTNGNIAADPLFANAAGGNFRLKSQGGRWNGLKWVLDLVSSPCLDSGDPASDFALEPAPNGGRINMGYDGNTVVASKAVPPTVVVWGPKGTTVGVTANINITFSEAMIRPSAQGAMFINGVKVSTSSTFGGTFTWLAKKMIFNPTNDLLPGTTYRIVIGKAARSRAGGCMTKGFSYEFTTKGAPPAAVTVAAAPTASGAQITLSLASAADVTVSIRNLAGREVAVLTPGQLAAGVQSLVWNGKSKTGTRVPSGTYLLQVSANGAQGTSARAMASLQLR